MSNLTVPTPAAIRRRINPEAHAVTPVAIALELDAPAKTVRPGTKVEIAPHDGVFKTKELRPGMQVRSWHSERGPRGAVKTIAKVTRLQGGGMYLVEYSSAHRPEERAAAYRWFCQDAADHGWPQEVPALVEYDEA